MIRRFLFSGVVLCCALSLQADALKEIQDFIKTSKESGAIETSAPGWKTRLPKFPPAEFAEDAGYEWVLETSEGTMVADLYPEAAPDHVRNILYLSSVGFYDGLIFHRIIPGFMAQGGCPRGTGRSGPGYMVDLEANATWRHEGPGVLSMARTMRPNTAGSQFFLTLKSTPQLDRQYTVFGKVTEGLEVLKKLEAAGNPDPRANGTPPLKKITIYSTQVRAKEVAKTP